MPELRQLTFVLSDAERSAAAGDFEAADRLLREAAALQESELGPSHPDLANTLNNLGVVCERRGEPDEAEPFYRRAYAITAAALEPRHPLATTCRENLATFCETYGRRFEPVVGIRGAGAPSSESELHQGALALYPSEMPQADEAATSDATTVGMTIAATTAERVAAPSVHHAAMPVQTVEVEAPVIEPVEPVPVASLAIAPMPIAHAASPAGAAVLARVARTAREAQDAATRALTAALDRAPAPVRQNRALVPVAVVLLLVAMALPWIGTSAARDSARRDDTGAAMSSEAAAVQGEPSARPSPSAPRVADAAVAGSSSPVPGLATASDVSAVPVPAGVKPASIAPREAVGTAGTLDRARTGAAAKTPAPAPARAAAASAKSAAAASTAGGGLAAIEARVCRTFSAGGPRGWVCEAGAMPLTPGPIVFYTRVRSPANTTIQHRWYRGDRLVKTSQLKVRASDAQGYRTYSRNTIGTGQGGDWRVELRTSDGTLLHEERFSVR